MIAGMKQIALPLALALIACGAAHAAPPPAEPARSEGAGRPISSATSYVQMEPLITAVHYGSGVSGILHVEMSLDVPEARLRARADERKARLRDAYTTAISTYAGLVYRRGDVPDIERITALLQRATDSVLGEAGAEVLLSMVIIHER